MTKIAVIGGGAWGTALAALQSRAGHETMLHARDEATVRAINETRRNTRYLPDIALPATLRATGDPGQALDRADAVLMVVPAQSLRAACRAIRLCLHGDVPIVVCSKGIERESGRFSSQIVAEELPETAVAVLSGPSFAADVARGLPTAVTIAAREETQAIALARLLSTQTFRCYASDDPTGVEAGGALKNVLAIAAGAVAGRGLGASAGAALITRGFVELRRLGETFGGRPETLMGLSGLGDLVLTCSSAQSRNFAYGVALGRGDDLQGLKLAEGVFSAGIAARMAAERGIDTPIIRTVAGLLAGETSIDAAVAGLLARPLKRETD